MGQVRAAFGVVSHCGRLPVMLEAFLGECPTWVVGKLSSNCSPTEEVRKHFHLISSEVQEYMSRYEVGDFRPLRNGEITRSQGNL